MSVSVTTTSLIVFQNESVLPLLDPDEMPFSSRLNVNSSEVLPWCAFRKRRTKTYLLNSGKKSPNSNARQIMNIPMTKNPGLFTVMIRENAIAINGKPTRAIKRAFFAWGIYLLQYDWKANISLRESV